MVFLALLAVFSFYSAVYGYRALSRKRPLDTEGARPLDWRGPLTNVRFSPKSGH